MGYTLAEVQRQTGYVPGAVSNTNAPQQNDVDQLMRDVGELPEVIRANPDFDENEIRILVSESGKVGPRSKRDTAYGKAEGFFGDAKHTLDNNYSALGDRLQDFLQPPLDPYSPDFQKRAAAREAQSALRRFKAKLKRKLYLTNSAMVDETGAPTFSAGSLAGELATITPFDVIPGKKGLSAANALLGAASGAFSGALLTPDFNSRSEEESENAALRQGAIGAGVNAAVSTVAPIIGQKISNAVNRARNAKVGNLDTEIDPATREVLRANNIPYELSDVFSGSSSSRTTDDVLAAAPLSGGAKQRDDQRKAVAGKLSELQQRLYADIDEALQQTQMPDEARHAALEKFASGPTLALKPSDAPRAVDQQTKVKELLDAFRSSTTNDPEQVLQLDKQLDNIWLSVQGDQKYYAAREAAASSPELQKVKIDNTAGALNDLIMRINSDTKLASHYKFVLPEIIKMRDGLLHGGKNTDFNTLSGYIQDLNSGIGGFIKEADDQKLPGAAELLQHAIAKDLKNATYPLHGKAADAYDLFAEAQAFYKDKNIGNLEQEMLTKKLNGPAPERAVDDLIKPGAHREGDAQRLVDGLSPLSRKVVNYQMFDKFMREAAGAGGRIDPAKFMQAYKKYQETVGVVFRGEEVKDIANFLKATAHLRNLSPTTGAAATSRAWSMMTYAATALGGAGVGLGGGQGVLAAGAGMGALLVMGKVTTMFRNGKFMRELLEASNKWPENDPRWRQWARRIAADIAKDSGVNTSVRAASTEDQ